MSELGQPEAAAAKAEAPAEKPKEQPIEIPVDDSEKPLEPNPNTELSSNPNPDVEAEPTVKMTKGKRQREKRRAKFLMKMLNREAGVGKLNGGDEVLRKESTVAASALTVVAEAPAEKPKEQPIAILVDDVGKSLEPSKPIGLVQAKVLPNPKTELSSNPPPNPNIEAKPGEPTVKMTKSKRQREKRRAKILILMERLNREAAEGKVNGADELLPKKSEKSTVAAVADVAHDKNTVKADAVAVVVEENTVVVGADVAEEESTVAAGGDVAEEKERIRAILMEKLNHDAVETKANGGDELLRRKAAEETTVAASADVAEENKAVAKIGEVTTGPGIKMSKGSRKRKRKAEKNAAMMSTVGTGIDVNNGIEAKIGNAVVTRVNGGDELLLRKEADESRVAASADVAEENKAMAKIGEVTISTVGTGIDVNNGIEAKIGDAVTVITDEATPTAEEQKELRKRRAERRAEMKKIMMNEEMKFRKRTIEKNNKEMMEVKRVREKYEAEVMKRMMKEEMEKRRQKLYSEYDAICVICRRRGHVIASCPELIDEPVVEKSKRKRLCPVEEILMTDETSGGKEDESVVKKSQHKRFCPVEETLMTDETSGGKEDESAVKKSKHKRLCPVEETLMTDETSGGKEDELVVTKSKRKKLCPAEETLITDETSGGKESESVVKKSKWKRLCPVEETLMTDETSGGKEGESVVKKSNGKRLCPAEETLMTDETCGDKEDESIVKHSEEEKMLGCAPEDTLKKDETSDGKHDEYIVENSKEDMLICSAETSGCKDEKCILKNVEEDKFLGSTAVYELQNEETSGGEECSAKIDSAEETHVKSMMEHGPGVVNPVA